MDPSKLPVQELLRLCLQSGDQALWLEFVRRIQPHIARVVIKSLRHWMRPLPDLVDDLVHETFKKLFASDFRALRDFKSEHENALFGFLKVVASRVVWDYFRKHGHELEHKVDFEDLDSVLPGAGVLPVAVHRSSAKSEHNIRIAEVDRFLQEHASERDRTIFWLYYQQEETAKAISELPGIGLTVKGVEAALLRLTRMVRARMNPGPNRPKPEEPPGDPGRAASEG